MSDVSMTAEEFLQALQIVELTRDYPNLKAVHDAMLKRCEDHAKDLLDKAEAAKGDVEVKETEPKVNKNPYESSMKR